MNENNEFSSIFLNRYKSDPFMRWMFSNYSVSTEMTIKDYNRRIVVIDRPLFASAKATDTNLRVISACYKTHYKECDFYSKQNILTSLRDWRREWVSRFAISLANAVYDSDDLFDDLDYNERKEVMRLFKNNIDILMKEIDFIDNKKAVLDKAHAKELRELKSTVG